MTDRIRITHPDDHYTGQIGYVVEQIDQHSLSTYVVRFKTKAGLSHRRAYQRNEFKFLQSIKTKIT